MQYRTDKAVIIDGILQADNKNRYKADYHQQIQHYIHELSGFAGYLIYQEGYGRMSHIRIVNQCDSHKGYPYQQQPGQFIAPREGRTKKVTQYNLSKYNHNHDHEHHKGKNAQRPDHNFLKQHVIISLIHCPQL